MSFDLKGPKRILDYEGIYICLCWVYIKSDFDYGDVIDLKNFYTTLSEQQKLMPTS